MAKSKNFYSYSEEPKAMAFIDIIGFGALTKKYSLENSEASLTFVFFENCILPYREKMLKPHKREVDADLNHQGHQQGFWYNTVPEGGTNFIYLSDSAVLYSCSLTNLIENLCNVFGSAITWAVPIRAVITLGDIHHSEWHERPGSAICLYGSSLTKAAGIEKDKSGKGMRIWLDSDVVELMQSIPDLKDLIKPALNGEKHAELKWWLKAGLVYNGKKDSEQLKALYDKWSTVKTVKDWFAGPNKLDTDKSIQEAIEDLKTIGR